MSPDEELEHKKQALHHLMGFAKRGMADEMRARHGKPPMQGMEEKVEHAEPPEDRTIPGVEATDKPDILAEEAREMHEEAGGAAPKPEASHHSPEVLRQLAEKLRAQRGR